MNLVTTDAPPTITPTALSCRVIREAGQLEALRQPWLVLLARSTMNEVMLTPMWLFTWWEIYGENSGRELRVGLFFDKERLVGIAPFFTRRVWRRPGIPFQRLEPLGADVDEQDGVCSDYLNLICENGLEQTVATSFAMHVAKGEFGAWDELVLPTMDGAGVMPAQLVRAFDDVGATTSLQQSGVSHYMPLPATWDEYPAMLAKRCRYLVRKTLREFGKWAGDDLKYHRVHSIDDINEGKRILHELHRERWQNEGESGVFAARRFQTFHDRVMPQLFDKNGLALFWITVGGKPIVADYAIHWNGKHYAYQGGRKMDLPKELRPGVFGAIHSIQHAIASGMREFDFLAGDAVYKRQLALATRPLVTFRAVRSKWKEGLRQIGEGGISCLRGARNGVRRMARWFRKKPCEKKFS